MQFTLTPPQLASSAADLIYKFADLDDDAVARDFDVSIIRSSDDKVLATKRFYATTSGQVNIAPTLRRLVAAEPSAGVTGLSTAEDYTVDIVVVADGVRSEVRRFTLLDITLDRAQVITSLPHSRAIAYGEREQVVIYAPEGAVVRVVAHNEASVEAQTYSAEGGLLRFSLDTNDFDPTLKSLSVVVTSEDMVLAELNYMVVVEPCGAWRVAWRNRVGGIEHYTFPVVEKRRVQVRRQSVDLASGEHLMLDVERDNLVRLVSAYETYRVLQALTEIVGAREVWRVSGTDYAAVEVVTTELSMPAPGTLCSVEIDVRSKGEERL